MKNVMNPSARFGLATVLALLTLLIFGTVSVFAQGPIYSESFETDGEGIRYTTSNTFNDGTSDHYQRTDGSDISNVSGSYSTYDGTYFWAAEDTDDGGGDGLPQKIITLTAVSISDYTNIQFKGLFGAGNENGPGASAYDAADEFKVEFSVDGGVFQNGVWFSYENTGDAFNEPIGLDANFDGQADVNGVNRLGTALQEFGFLIPDGDNVVIRMTVSMASGNEEIAFDNFRILGDGIFLTKSVTPTTNVIPNDPVTYTISLANTNVVSDTNALLTDTLPISTTFSHWVMEPAGTIRNGNAITWTGTITANEGITFTLVASYTGNYSETVTNTTYFSGTGVTRSDDATFAVPPATPELSVSKSGPDSVVAGEDIVYQISLENTGGFTAVNTVLTDTLPVSVTYVSDDSGWTSGASTIGSRQVITWDAGDLASGASPSFNLTATVNASVTNNTVITNDVEIISDGIEGNTGDNSDQWETTVYQIISIYDIQYVSDPPTEDVSPYKDQHLLF